MIASRTVSLPEKAVNILIWPYD